MSDGRKPETRAASRSSSGGGSRSGQEPGVEECGADGSALVHVLLNLAFLGGGGLLFHAAGDLPDSRWEPLGSGAFPRLVLALLMLLNAVVIVSNAGRAVAELRENGGAIGGIVVGTLRSYFVVIATFALFGLFLLAIQDLGFVASAFLFIFVVQLLLGPITARSVVVALAVSAVTAVGVDYVFEAYFNVFLPSGRVWR